VSWQLVAGGLALLPVAVLVEGAPPAIDVPAVLGYAWIAVVGTGLAYVCWFTGLRAMPAGAVSLIGLVNPVVGTALGVAFAAEAFGWVQAFGMALVLGGVLLGQRSARPRRTERPAEKVMERAAARPLAERRSERELVAAKMGE
jgi:probable blue pigment (indigoidine) exporter